ncbi:MAG TPA: copper resistance protein CopC [Terrimesophilobacter sp.]|nr:copper resistance protein CopC [Terrimesophilobacter sp.]
MRTTVVSMVLAVAALFGVATAASAHNFVVSTTPGEGETLTSLPERFSISTNDSLLDVTGDGNAFVLDIIDSGGLYYGDGCVTVEGSTMSTDAALGTAGTYTIAYQFVSADGHSVSGEYAFEWAPADSEQLSEAWVTPPVCGEERIQIPNVAVTPEPSAEPSTDAAPSAVPDESSELNAGAAVIVAVVLAMLLLRRRK